MRQLFCPLQIFLKGHWRAASEDCSQVKSEGRNIHIMGRSLQADIETEPGKSVQLFNS